MTDNHPPEPDHVATVEEAVAARLARLAERRASTKSTEETAAPQTPTPRSSPTTKKKKQHKKRRCHAAMGSRGVTFVVSVGATVAMTLGFARTNDAQPVEPTGIVTASPVAEATNQTVINGDSFTNKWGPVQVQVTFDSAGQIVGVDAVATPSRDNKSVRINDRAVPVLNGEVLVAQSAQVDSVSGATYTSTDYKRSLQSAIDAARAAGLAP